MLAELSVCSLFGYILWGNTVLIEQSFHSRAKIEFVN